MVWKLTIVAMILPSTFRIKLSDCASWFALITYKRMKVTVVFIGFYKLNGIWFLNFPRLADLLGYLLNSPDLCSPSEFLDRYDKPFDCVLDQGKFIVGLLVMISCEVNIRCKSWLNCSRLTHFILVLKIFSLWG